MSDISSDNLSTSDEEERRTKGVAQIPDLPEQPGFALPHTPQLEAFWEQEPLPEVESTWPAELVEHLEVTLELNEFLKKKQKELEEQLQAEWVAKERTLDELLQKELGADAPVG